MNPRNAEDRPTPPAPATEPTETPNACCSPGEQAACCEPSHKQECCAPQPAASSGCGCR